VFYNKGGRISNQANRFGPCEIQQSRVAKIERRKKRVLTKGQKSQEMMGGFSRFRCGLTTKGLGGPRKD